MGSIKKYDLRTQGHITSVKDQGSYPVCWAFSSNNVSESSMLREKLHVDDQISTKNNLDLSEAQLVHAFYNRKNDPLGLTNGDKNYAPNFEDGGNTYIAAVLLSQWSGLCKENDAKLSLLKNYKKIDQKIIYSHKVSVLENAYFYWDGSPTNTLKQAIMDHGALTVSFNSNHDYYNEKYSSYYAYDDYSVDHSVSIIGWDDDFSRNKFNKKPPKNGAWICKNSWGEDWGDNGYFYLSYYDFSISTICAHDMMESTKYKNNYFYDGSAGLGEVWGPTVTAYQVFEGQMGNSSLNEYLSAVQVGVGSTNTKIKVEVFHNLKDQKNPQSGSKVSEITVTKEYAGIYTIPLEQSVLMEKGKKIVVKVTVSSTVKDLYASLYTAMDDDYGWVSFYEKTAPNQSYIQIKNEKMYDGHKYGYCARIKALTTEENSETLTISNTIIKNLENQLYTGKELKPHFELYDEEKLLEEGKDYTVNYSHNIDRGYAMLTIKGVGNYSGEKVEYFKISEDISSADVVLASSRYVYVGKEIKPSIQVISHGKVLKNGTDYKVSYKNNINPNKNAEIKISGQGFCIGVMNKTFTITKQNISKCQISVSNMAYTGKALKPKVTVKIGNKTLSSKNDYTITYKNNKNTGKATVTVSAKSSSPYVTGKVTKNFYIVPKKVTISNVKSTAKGKLTVQFKKVTGASGYQIAYRKKGTTAWSYVTTSSSSRVITKLTSKKYYEVKVRAYKTVSQVKKYGAYSIMKTIKVK